jgi:hypothetical protein
VDRAAPTLLVGWAADINKKTVPPVVIVELVGEGRYFAAAVRASPRPDVAEVMKAPSLVGAGWDLLGDFSPVPPGAYDLRLLSVSAEGIPEMCDPKHKLVVR